MVVTSETLLFADKATLFMLYTTV